MIQTWADWTNKQKRWENISFSRFTGQRNAPIRSQIKKAGYINLTWMYFVCNGSRLLFVANGIKSYIWFFFCATLYFVYLSHRRHSITLLECTSIHVWTHHEDDIFLFFSHRADRGTYKKTCMEKAFRRIDFWGILYGCTSIRYWLKSR